MEGPPLPNALFENRVVEPSKKRLMATMYVDVDALREQLDYIRLHIADLKAQGGQDRKLRYFLVLYEMLHEMYTKLKEHKSMRLDFWGQP